MLRFLKRVLRPFVNLRRALRPIVRPLGRTQSLQGLAGNIEILRAPERGVVTAQYPYRLRVTNVGEKRWPGGLFPVRLGVHWRASNGKDVLVHDDGRRISLPHRLEPGEHVELTFPLTTLNSPGRYIIEFDLVREHVGWIGAGATGTTQVGLEIIGRRAAEGNSSFNYDDLYARADLDSDYWTVVGPGTREEFESLGRGKHALLVAQGLKPSSRVLDVGCGTGQLTEPMVEFLGPDGLYYGTDIAQPAIEFCRRRFPQSNFHFLRNGMTSIPITGVQFDFIYLGSVFTHMFPDEIRSMLCDFTRLLAPGGAVIADAFVATIPNGFAGSRSMVEIDETLLYNHFEAAGYQADILQTVAWAPGIRRPIFKLSRRSSAAA